MRRKEKTNNTVKTMQSSARRRAACQISGSKESTTQRTTKRSTKRSFFTLTIFKIFQELDEFFGALSPPHPKFFRGKEEEREGENNSVGWRGSVRVARVIK